MAVKKNRMVLLLSVLCLFCLMFGGVLLFGEGNVAYAAYSSSTKYKLDVTATGTDGIYIYVNGASGSGTITDGAALNFAPNRCHFEEENKTRQILLYEICERRKTVGTDYIFRNR